ncbi:MAG: hypothetical protein ACRDSP_22435 [Pseudonocardiaceae bacterium]
MLVDDRVDGHSEADRTVQHPQISPLAGGVPGGDLSIGDELSNTINRSLPQVAVSPWRRAADYAEQLLNVGGGNDLPGCA